MDSKQSRNFSVSNGFETLIQKANEVSQLLKAISHPRRLMIICLLAERERTVSEIQKITSIPQSVVSHQLARLRLDQLVNAERKGRHIYYSLADEEAALLVDVLSKSFCNSKQTRLIKSSRDQSVLRRQQDSSRAARANGQDY